MGRAMVWILGVAALSLLGGCAWVLGQRAIETPDYAVVRTDGDIELRDYPELIAAETDTSGARREAANRGFRPLANYIFAKSRGGDQIAMTAPVTQEKIAMTAPVTQTEDAQDRWKVRFIMPAKYSRESLPEPGPGVEIVTLPPARVAAIRFSGGMEGAVYAESEARLREWIAAQGLLTAGPATFAYYNDPFTPGFLRRNEILIPVETD